MRRVLIPAFSLVLVLVALPLRVDGEEICRSGYIIIGGKSVCLDEEESQNTNGLQSAFLALLRTLENAAERVINEVAEQ
jgi:hypothetical protein